jgi:hypothetical protein
VPRAFGACADRRKTPGLELCPYAVLAEALEARLLTCNARLEPAAEAADPLAQLLELAVGLLDPAVAVPEQLILVTRHLR